MTDALRKIPKIKGLPTIFIAGPVASGKTFLLKHLISQFERSLILDAGADYLGEEYSHVWSNPKELADKLRSNPHYYRIAYHPNSEFFAEDFHWCFSCIWTMDFPRWFIIEESHEVCGNNCMHPDVNTILRYARHNLLGVIASSQRIADVDKLLTGMARMVVFFHTSEYRDIEAIRFRWGPKVSEAVEQLRPCIYNDATKECEQHPECLIYVKGYGASVVPLGDKVKSQSQQTEEGIECLEEQGQAQPQEHNPSSLPPDSGTRELQSQESTSEAT